jgi:hypothetical protein
MQRLYAKAEERLEKEALQEKIKSLETVLAEAKEGSGKAEAGDLTK